MKNEFLNSTYDRYDNNTVHEPLKPNYTNKMTVIEKIILISFILCSTVYFFRPAS